MNSLRAVHDPDNQRYPIVLIDDDNKVIENLTHEEAMFLAIFMNAKPRGMYEPLRSEVPVQKSKRS